MGCDIHMHVEYKDDRRTNGVWVSGDYYTRNECGGFSLVEFCGDRNYHLFAILADVRNNGDYTYIDMPRGIPDDATETVRIYYAIWGMDAHSASYFTLKELIDFYKENKDDQLEFLIRKLKERADELNVIWDFEWEHDGSGIGYEKSDNIRIVFWFDN